MAKAVMNKYATNKPFPVEVCDMVRYHVGTRLKLEGDRKKAHEDRDAALAELEEFEDEHSDEAVEAKERHSDAVRTIERLAAQIKFHGNEVDRMIEQADSPELEFMYEPHAEQDSSPRRGKDVAGQIRMGPPPPADAGNGVRPVGRPAGSKPGAVKPEAPDPSKGDGVDEHLKAGIQELNLDEEITAALIAKGFTTVGRVAALIEKTDGDIIEPTGLSASDAAVVRGAVAKYRKAHRSAMREAESGEAPPVGLPTGRRGR